MVSGVSPDCDEPKGHKGKAMDNNTCGSTTVKLASILEKVESLDDSMRISMSLDNRRHEPLVKLWLYTLQDIRNDILRLTETDRQR